MPLDEGERGLRERVAVLEEVVRTFKRELDEVTASIDGPPWERSVRGRLHVMESEASAARAAGAALAEAQAERRRAREDRERAERNRWGWRWKVLAGVTSVALALAPYVALFWGGR